jgi:hypothetical protein
MKQKPAKQLRKLARLFATATRSRMRYSRLVFRPTTANGARLALSKPMLAQLASESVKLAELGKVLSLEQ